MNQPKVLIVTPFQLSDTGGVTSSVIALRDELTAMGHDVNVLVPADSDRVVKLQDGLYGVYMRSPFVDGVPLKSLAGFAAHLPITLLALKRFLERERIDVVAVQYPLPWMAYLGVLRRFSRWKLVVTYQGSDAHDLPTWSRTDRTLVGLLLRNADAIVAVSRTLADTVSSTLPAVERERIRIIPNGAAEYSPAAGPAIGGLPADYIVTVGHLIHRKGVDTLIDALRLAIDRGLDLDLVIVGDGPDRASLEERASRAGLQPRVRFVGMRSQEETLSIMAGSRLFVLASRAEGLPLVIVEAMSCGRPVVATAVDGVPDIVRPDETGLLVPPDDPQALAEALLTLGSDAALQQRLGANALRLHRDGYTWRAIAVRYTELFSGLMRGTAATRDDGAAPAGRAAPGAVR